MKNEFIISTTNNIENCPITRYIDTICSNIVIGTNIFSDFAASFTDFFGGKSNSYQKKLELIYNEATKELKRKAIRIGANAIIGFKIDFDEISGKDKSMFMVSVSGTACIIDYRNSDTTTITNNNIITQTELDKEINRRYIISKINEGANIREAWIEFLLENPQIEIIENLLDRYISYYKETDHYKESIDFIERYMQLLPREDAIEAVYKKHKECSPGMNSLISNCNLFDSTKILSVCKIDIHASISLLLTNSDYYQQSDIKTMNEICSVLTSLPDTGKIEMVKGGLLGKEQEKFICKNGHKSAPDCDFCENFNCGINIKGLTREEVDIIDKYKTKMTVLADMLG